MSTFNFALPGNFTVTQNANLYIMDMSTLEPRRYQWIIECGSNLNTMFNTRTYTQTSGNNQAYTANLTVNMTQVNLWLNGTPGLTWDPSTPGAGTIYGLETSGPRNFNFRLLEMAALEIFGHAKARAAIANDNLFDSLHGSVTAHISDTFSIQSTRNNFFEQYVEINRYYNSDDITGTVSFNLASTSVYVFGYLNGNIVDATTTPPLTTGTVGSTGIFLKNNYSAPMRIQFKGVA